MGRLDGKVVFVTGAARGQGRAHAVRFAEEGADVIAIDICEQIRCVPFKMATPDDLAETARQVEALDRRIVARVCDVRDSAAMSAVLEEGVAELGRLDFAIANAGISSFGPSTELTEEEWDDVVAVDQKGVWLTAKLSIPHIRKHGEGGSIVMTASAAGLHPYANIAHYVGAKHAVIGIMKTMAVELGPERIRVNAICPSQCATPMLLNEDIYPLFCPDVENPTIDDFAPVSQAMNVLPTPWVEAVDIANAAVFLCSDEGRFITGVPFPVDAGRNLIG